jgi:hypothetical protein
MKRKRNPTTVLQQVEVNLIQDAVLITAGVVIVGVVGYLIYQKLQSAVPTVRNTLPLLLSTTPGVDPLPPIDMPGRGSETVPFTSDASGTTSGPDNTLVAIG